MESVRQLALASLIKWEESKVFSNIELSNVIARNNLSKRDASLYTLLYLGVIEKKLYLDHIIKAYSKSNIKDLDVITKNALRLGLYQLRFTDKIPEHSAVDESVSLAPKRSKGFVNAILRSFLRANRAENLPKDKWERISISTSTPHSICDIFKESYGEALAEKILTYTPKNHISLRINTLKASETEIIDSIKENGYECQKSQIAEGVILTNAPISALAKLIDNGSTFVQDEASRIASMVVGAKKGERVADVCACPGGKSFSMAIDMQNAGELYSADLHKNKLSLIEKGAKRLGIDIIKVREQNAKISLPEYEGYFDKVLCDVPCSGLGVIFKKPDIKYKSIENIEALPQIQYEILNASSKYVKAGGVLVYSTCTLNKKENEDNVEKFLVENPSFKPYDFSIGKIKSMKGGYTFFPHENHTDGFFVARMIREE